jgi:DNA-binding Lrp family transcriptional regulator
MNVAVLNPALALADQWQRGFPLVPRPFAELGSACELSQAEVIELLGSLKDQGCLARIGATVRPNTVGASTLAAVSVPVELADHFAHVINAHAGVNHNYEREHAFNLWFVVTAADRASVLSTLDEIGRQCSSTVLDLPLVRPYHIDLGFRLDGSGSPKMGGAGCQPGNWRADDADISLLAALETGLGLVEDPYAELGRRSGLGEDEVMARLSQLIDNGIITRFGCILRHRRIGYRANAMAVWDVPDDQVDDIAQKLAQRSEVTLCYRRKRRLPDWRYNLFAMVHGRERATVLDQIDAAARDTGLAEFTCDILFSTRCFKQSAARMSRDIRGAA